MTDPDRNDSSPLEPIRRGAVEMDNTVAAGELPSSAPGVSSARALTPEEQMALYEEDLKENDWGHQPC